MPTKRMTSALIVFDHRSYHVEYQRKVFLVALEAFMDDWGFVQIFGESVETVHHMELGHVF